MVWTSMAALACLITQFRRKGAPKALAIARVSISKAARIISRLLRKSLFLQVLARTDYTDCRTGAKQRTVWRTLPRRRPPVRHRLIAALAPIC
jgi:hypothetical protein